ncbi:MAG: glutamine--fructose-6-phosphate transaminase (isomerizing) [Bacteriovoracia bacterium]
MCGIMGYVGHRPAVDLLIKGLKRLEYRGYDSAGVAYFDRGAIRIQKSEGKLTNVEKLFDGSSGAGSAGSTCGIGHTRWATHGKPTTQNAHPHKTGHVVLVHNGIIENYQAIRQSIVEQGHQPASETDSELFGFLVLEEMKRGHALAEAVRLAFLKLEGSCSVVVLSEKEPGVVVGVRNGSPLVAAVDPEGGAMLASDAQPLLEYTRDVTFVENGDMVVGTLQGLEFRDFRTGERVRRDPTTLNWSPDKLDKRGYPHYMIKEIFEQPTALVDTLNATLDRGQNRPFALADQPGVALLREAKQLVFVACGTSSYAALLAKYWIEQWAKVPVSVELASEFRYRDPVVAPGTLVVGISQSGETADTLAVIREMKRRNVKCVGLTNVRGSTITREVDATFFTSAGPEIAVAGTKSFMTQLYVLILWAGYLAAEKQALPADRLRSLFDDVLRIPHVLATELDEGSAMVKATRVAARRFAEAKGFFFIGRGFSFPIALEGALKLKEIAYHFADGYAAGELKHGPIAMIDKDMVVVVLAPDDGWREKTFSNLQEVKARGARILGVGTKSDALLKRESEEFVPVEVGGGGKGLLDPALAPLVLAPVVQLLSYEVGVLRGTDVDQPRNLAKSVTVE